MAKLNEDAESFRVRLTPDLQVSFARRLGVSPRALRELECGVATAQDMTRLRVGFGGGERPSEALTFPERDAHGELVGFCFRSRDGCKGTAQGTKRGLVFSPLDTRPDPIVIVEGPSDAAAGLTLHLSIIGRASCTAGDEMLTTIASLGTRDVIVLADADTVGRAGARKLARSLATAFKRTVRWSTLPGGAKDLRAHLLSLSLDVEDDERCAREGERLLEHLAAVANVEEPQRLTRCIANVERKALKWLVTECLPLGKLVIVAGNPGLGKSLVTIDIGARLTRGEGMAGEPIDACDVLYLSAEDDASDTIRPRLEEARANLARAHVSECLDIRELRAMLDERPHVRLVVIDPLSAYTGQLDTHKDAQVRTFLAEYVELARERGVTVLFVAHLRKSGDGPAIMKPGGSIGFVAAARVAWLVAADPKDPQRRLFVPLKNNLGPDALGWAYRIASIGADGQPRIEWEPERVTTTADEALAVNQSRRERAGRGEALRDACEFVRQKLADGPCAADEVFDSADAAGISKATVRRARVALDVVVRKCGMRGGWEWALPPTDAEEAQTDETCEAAHSASREPSEPLRGETDPETA